MDKIVLFGVISLVSVSEGVVYSSLPDHLLPCYRGGGPALGAPRRLDVFLSLVKKLELNNQLDMRLFSTSLLRNFRLDGIEEAPNAVETEYVTPYRASGFQFNRYKLLMDLFLPTQNLLEPDESWSVGEKCLLHRMLSGGVQLWERGDEDRVCPLAVEQRGNMVQNETRVISRCPIEVGVIKTEWGTIAPGTLVAAVAAALEPQRVAVTDILNADVYKSDVAEPLMASAKEEWYNDIETLDNADQTRVDVADINNLYVATLVGDLAEVVVNQGPRVGSAAQRMVIGSNNRWNDTMLPRNYFMYPQNSSIIDWHMTDAEILAGIDGIILAHYLPAWIAQRNSLKLSQVIDMYYSNEGVSFEPRVKACNRQSLFRSILDSPAIATETSRFAHVLYLMQGGVYIPVEKMNRISDAAASAFSEYLTTVFSQNHKECQVGTSLPQMNLIVATDAAWKGYDVEAFISWVGGALEMDMERSTLGLLHGNTGRWIAPPSNNMTAVFSHISNFADESTVFSQNHKECQVGTSLPQMNLIVATDAAWKGYDVEAFISWVGGALEMDMERSTLGLLHGNTGRWIAPPSNNMTAVFSHISNFADEWPNRMNIPNVISAIIQHSQNQSILEQSSSAGISTVVLIVSPSDRPSANEVERARELMNSLRSSFFDIYFAYASQDLGPFQNINNEYLDYSEIFLQTESTSVVDVVNAVDIYLVKSELPTRIIGVQCPYNDTVFNLVPYEDFVTPGLKQSYRIHPFYLRQQPLINVQFRNDGHGRLLVCMWRGADSSHSCESIPERGVHAFNMTTPCPSVDFCTPAHFVVTAPTTLNSCANNDCRFPNQVGYYIQHSGLRCLPLRGSASTISLHGRLQSFTLLVILYFIISLCIFNL